MAITAAELRGFSAAAKHYARSFGWIRCRRHPMSLHHPDYKGCDCVRCAPPLVPHDARALSHGALRT